MQEPEFPFETPEWVRLVADCYGFEDCSVRTRGGFLPLLRTRSPLLGDKLVSAVFNSYASPCYETEAACDALVAEAVARARRERVDYLEIRSVRPLPEAVAARHGLLLRPRYKATHLRLGEYREVEARYERKFRKNLRVARHLLDAQGVSFVCSREREDLRRFHELLVRRYRDRHRMLPQPYKLFTLIHERFLETDRAQLFLARRRDGELLAGLLFLTQGATVTGAFGAAEELASSMSLDAIFKDHTIRHYCERGFRLYDFGITSPKQAGVLFAKSRFQGETFDLPSYYHLVRALRPPEIDYADAFPWLRRGFRHLPLPLVKRLSTALTPYLS